MILEANGLPLISKPTDTQVRNLVLSLRAPKPTFASLTDDEGNYVQVGGARPWCVVEWRQVSPAIHQRANADSVRRPYRDGAPINFGTGPIPLRADEWLLLKQAADIFAAFRAGQPFPDFVRWRIINSLIGLPE
jgi:hypothetical protein